MMTDNEFKAFKGAMKIISDESFVKFIKKQREGIKDKKQEGFIDMLERSNYFKDLYFEAFIAGIDFVRGRDNENI